MIEWLQLAEELTSSPWLYLILIVVSLLDSFLPAVPSEPVVVVAGVTASTGDASLILVLAATAVGAFVGDTIPYGIGRVTANPILRRLPPDTKRRAAYDWLHSELETRAGFVLITSRFIPVGRYLVTLCAGITRLHWPKFATFTAISVAAWSTYTVLAGYLGGVAFQDNPLLAVGAGFALAILITGAIGRARPRAKTERTRQKVVRVLLSRGRRCVSSLVTK